MKHKMWSRLLSMALAVMMITSIVPNSAFAEAASEITSTSQVQVEETPVVENDVPQDEVIVPEEETPAVETPVESVEPTVEPTAEPTAEPTQAPEATTVPSEQPSTEPTATPEATEAPNASAQPSESPAPSATPAPSASPLPSETPVPTETPAPSEEPAIDGQALLDELMAIEDDEAFMQAVNELTEEQVAALEALGEDALADYTLRVESLTAPEETPISELHGEELAEKLMELSDEELMDNFRQLTEEQLESLRMLDLEVSASLESRVSQLQEKVMDNTQAAPFTSVGPIVPFANTVMRSRSMFSATKHESVEPVDGLLINKAVELHDASQEIFKIDLQAEAESNIVVTSVPCDIILVLDRSGSMKDDNKYVSLNTAAKNFITTIQKNSPESRVAIVAYSDNASIYSGNKNIDGAFVPVTETEKLGEAIDNATKSPSGGTYSNHGLELTWNIYSSISVDDPAYNNARAVVMFTDGIPGSGLALVGDWGVPEVDLGDSHRVAQDSIYWGQVLKAEKGSLVNVVPSDSFYGVAGKDFVERRSIFDDWKLKESRKNMTGSGAVVYTVGLNLPSNDVKVNEYMYRLSSNRPDGTHVSEWGDGGYTNERTRNLPNGYYITTENASELDKIFQQIADQTGKPIENAIIRDYISPYFQLVDKNGTPIQVGDTIQSGEHVGTVCKDQNGIYVEWNNVNLKPMEPGKPETAEKFSGTLYIKPKAEFMGGTNVPTNISGISGVYSNDGNCIGSFKECVANVRVKNEYNVQDQSIYITNSANISSMIVANENGPRPFVSFGGGAYSNDFVETVYTVKDSDGKTVGTWTFEKGKDGVWKGEPIGPDECSQYTVSCTVENTSIPPMAGNNEAWVHVFTPTVTWKDSSQDYNTVLSKELLKAHVDNTKWGDRNHPGQNISDANIPVIDFEFAGNIVGLNIQQNLNVKVSKVLINGKDKTAHVSFDWVKGTDCPTECTGAPKDAHFRIHLKTGNLTITKTVSNWNEESGNQATFLFEVKKTGTSEKVYYMSVTVDKAKMYGDATLNGLPAGEYTIQEIPTYGYEVEGDKTQNKTIGSGTTTKVYFTNTAAPEDYTKDGSMAINRFNKDDSGNWTWTWANKPTGLFR